MSEHVSFRQMKDGTAADYALLAQREHAFATGTAGRLLGLLRMLEDSLSGYQVSRLEHSLQTATRAERDGADADWVVAALLHDVGDLFAPHNHDTLAAAIIRPYVREECSWTVEHHGVFQLAYYGHHIGADPEARRKFEGHPHYAAAVRFCERWDQASFDPDYDTLPLDHFAPVLQAVLARPPWDPAVLQPATGT